jgi:ATP-dependent RNA helicase DeaD
MHKKPQVADQFAELGLSTSILHAAAEAGFETPSDIQKALIPLILEGKDVLGQARTGTGKTAGFGLPILQQIRPEQRLQALVLVPTRELAVQVAAELRRLSPKPDIHVVPIYGGQKIRYQQRLLGKKPHIVVGTPGRVIDMLDRKILDIRNIRYAILDEVDRMLDIGFRDDIRNILSRIEADHQTVLVSATVNDDIKALAQRHTTNAEEVNVSRDELTVEEVEQTYMTVEQWDKPRLLKLLLEQEKPKLAIVFCNTKHGAMRLAKKLRGEGIDAREIHGDLVQQKREKVMNRFRKHRLNVLIATDLAARGIDVQGITHIVNYDIPQDPNVYVHRIGRTARMGTFGKAITFVTREEGKELTSVEMLIEKVIPQDHVEGFNPRPPREEQEEEPEKAAPQPAKVSSENSDDFGKLDDAGPRKKKSIGGKHKPSRRRRR